MFTMEFAASKFFDPKAFDRPIAKAKKKILSQFGAYVRKVAQNSIKTGAATQHSPPGVPPTGHSGSTRYKDFIFYFYDAAGDSVVIGGAALPRRDSAKVPQALERGGQTTGTRQLSGGKRVKETIMLQARPHMVKAYEIAVKKFLPQLIENSIVP